MVTLGMAFWTKCREQASLRRLAVSLPFFGIALCFQDNMVLEFPCLPSPAGQYSGRVLKVDPVSDTTAMKDIRQQLLHQIANFQHPDLDPLLQELQGSLTQLVQSLPTLWQPSESEQQCAWEIHVELRTRITTQRLHYLDGDETTALESLVRLFAIVREVCRTAGPTASVATDVADLLLNQVLRPLTARWHERKLAGKLNPEDLRREFRGELTGLQARLQLISSVLSVLATGRQPRSSEPTVVDAAGARALPTPASEPLVYDRVLGLEPAVSDRLVLAEVAEIQARRAAVNMSGCGGERPAEVVGLAISGGGIRSATFSLGAIQSLARHGILQQVDLLSTVSGGGYTGCFLSSYLNTADPSVGTQPDRQPFRAVKGTDSEAIRYIRNRSRYIQPRGFVSWVTTIAHAAYGIFSNLLILLAWVFLAVAITDCVIKDQLCNFQTEAARLLGSDSSSTFVTAALPESPSVRSEPWRQQSPSAIENVLVAVGAKLRLWWPDWLTVQRTTYALYFLTGALLLSLPVWQRIFRARGGRFSRLGLGERLVLGSLLLSCLFCVVVSFPRLHFGYAVVMKWIGESLKIGSSPGEGWSITASIVTLTNALGLLAARGAWVRELAVRLPLVGRGLFLLLWAAGPIMLGYTYFELCRVFVAVHSEQPLFTVPVLNLPFYSLGTFLLLSSCCFLYSFLCNVNFFSLHRFYRNRLGETFLLEKAGSGIRVRENLKLSELRSDPASPAPYHLINAAVNLPCSWHEELRGRDCDFFLMSKHFCGGPVLRYEATREYERMDSHFDLAAAMAISGAAAAPQMGVGTVKGASFLMTLLNVRLGYWLQVPGRWRLPPGPQELLGGPGPLYLLKEAMNSMDEKAAFLNLSDGGHIENLAVMELLRRRCRTIIAIDGEHDPKLEFSSLRVLQRYALIDLGVDIQIDCSRIQWTTSAISPGTPEHMGRSSRAHFACGRILYPADDNGIRPTGWLIYLKLSVTGNEPDVVNSYRLKNSAFPHDPTLTDQVFDEAQFEAYRCLGEHAADDLFSDELLAELEHAGGKRASELRKNRDAGQLATGDWVNALRAAFRL
jgi:hypothetical protein